MTFNQAALSFVFLISLIGCQSSPTGNVQDTCSVSPPTDIKLNPKLAAEAAADLSKFAKLPMSANFKLEVSNQVQATFQKVPDAVAACAMLNQTYVCIRDSQRAQQYLQFMQETSQCKAK